MKRLTTQSDESPARSEVLLAWTFLALTLVLWVVYVLRFRVESDEPQHLHVVWGWARGMIQYRDFFDNHTPLFHMLCAPLVVLLGDRADLLVLMRLAMLPLWVLSVRCVYLIGARAFSRRIGLWSAVVTAAAPPLLLRLVEFRADTLWVLLWLAALAVMLGSPVTRRRWFVAGLLLGSAAGVSLKTTFLLAGLAGAMMVTVLATARTYPWRRDLPRLAGAASSALLGFLVVPLALVLLFAALGALEPFYHGTIGHNLLPGLGRFQWYRVVATLGVLLVGVLAALPDLRQTPATGRTLRRTCILSLGGTLLAALVFWPIRTVQSLMPIYPPLILLVLVCIDRVGGRLLRLWRRGARTWALPSAAGVLAAVLLGWLVFHVPRENNVAPHVRTWQDVLRLTDPGQTVMDQKGELIFRRRVWYPVLEELTRERLQRGLLVDDIPECLAAGGTCVTSFGRMPPRATAFIRENFVSVGRLNVAGMFLGGEDAVVHNAAIVFEVKVPATYSVVTPSGRGTGLLDGTPCGGGRFLEAGRHVYRPAAGESHLALVWTQAVDRGFLPLWSSETSP